MNEQLYKTHEENIKDIQSYTEREMEIRLTTEGAKYFARQKSVLRLVENFIKKSALLDEDNKEHQDLICDYTFEMLNYFVMLYPNSQMLENDIQASDVFQRNFLKIIDENKTTNNQAETKET